MLCEKFSAAPSSPSTRLLAAPLPQIARSIYCDALTQKPNVKLCYALCGANCVRDACASLFLVYSTLWHYLTVTVPNIEWPWHQWFSMLFSRLEPGTTQHLAVCVALYEGFFGVSHLMSTKLECTLHILRCKRAIQPTLWQRLKVMRYLVSHVVWRMHDTMCIYIRVFHWLLRWRRPKATS